MKKIFFLIFLFATVLQAQTPLYYYTPYGKFRSIYSGEQIDNAIGKSLSDNIVTPADVMETLRNNNLYSGGDSLNFSGNFIRDTEYGHYRMGDDSAFTSRDPLNDNFGFSPTLSVFKYRHDAFPTLALRSLIDDNNFNGGTSQAICGFNQMQFLINSGTMGQNIIGSQSDLRLKFGVTASATSDNSARQGNAGILSNVKLVSGNLGTITNVSGFRSVVDGWEGGAGGTVTYAIGFNSYIAHANATFTNSYGFYSNIQSGSPNGFHFYGSGNFPIWNGGSVNSGYGYNYAADAQANDSYVITLAGAHTLVAGLEVTFKANTANTGAATLQVNSLTVKNLTKASAGSVATALATGDIIAGQIVKAVYDGAQFQVISRLAQ